jgi:uncharacterized protein
MTSTEILRARLESKPGVVGATIITASGRYFDFLDPKPEQIHIGDIAWALSQICRFGGQSLEFYSVAQHSILVSELVPDEYKFAALLHDAAEAYVGDMVGPLKKLIPDFKTIEKRCEAVIFQKFGVTMPLDPCIKHADLRMLRTEQRDLTAGSSDNWNGLDQFEPTQKIIPMTQRDAASAFMEAFYRLADGDRK